MNKDEIASPGDFTTVSGDGIFSGYAALFGVPDIEGDVVIHGAFSQELEGGVGKIRMLFGHDENQPIGKWLEIKEDVHGLFVRGQLDLSVTRAREIKSLMESGSCDGLSIMAEIVDEEKIDGGRVLKRLKLWEISICTFPIQQEAGADQAAVRRYSSNSDLPLAVRRVLPREAMVVYRKRFNKYIEKHPETSAARAHAVAWRAVRRGWCPPAAEAGTWSLKIDHKGARNMVQFADTVVLDGARRTRDGYLVADVKVARTGIQIYRGWEVGRPEMDEVRVYRPEQEVFTDAALHSFAHRPVTVDHPSELVTSKNWRHLAVGQTGDEIKRDGDFIRVPMCLMDEAAIDAVFAGKKELSMGYLCDLQWEKGTTSKGEMYDAVQRNITGNHLAIVGAARGGPELRIGDELRARLVEAQEKFASDEDAENYRSTLRAIRTQAAQDSVDAVVIACDGSLRELDDNGNRKDNDMPDVKTTKVEVDGLEVEVTDSTVAILKKGLANLMAKAQNLQEKVEEKEKAEEEKKKETDAAMAAKDAEIATLKKTVEDGKITPDRLDAMVKDRSTVIDHAKKLVGDKLVTDGKSEADIRRLVVTAKIGDESKEWSDEQVKTSFDTMAKFANDAGGETTDKLSHAIRTHQPTSDETDKAYDERDHKLTSAWKASAA